MLSVQTRLWAGTQQTHTANCVHLSIDFDAASKNGGSSRGLRSPLSSVPRYPSFAHRISISIVLIMILCSVMAGHVEHRELVVRDSAIVEDFPDSRSTRVMLVVVGWFEQRPTTS